MFLWPFGYLLSKRPFFIMKYLKKFANHSEYVVFTNGQDFLKPNTSVCVNEYETHFTPEPYDYSQDYLTFVALENGTFKCSGYTVSYSVDDGATWTSLASNTNTPTVNAGHKILWKGSLSASGRFSSTGRFDVQGNVMSLFYGDDFQGRTELPYGSPLKRAFSGCTKLINAENLILPATSVGASAYTQAFTGCTSLVTAPELPATQLSSYCYYGMFNGCSSLVKAPDLPATTLPTQNAYSLMFFGCSSLNYLKCMAIDGVGGVNTQNWFNGVPTGGTFVKNANAIWTETFGTSCVPTGWTVITA